MSEENEQSRERENASAVESRLADVFSYHAPDAQQQAAFPPIRAAAKELARVILLNCPPCADRTYAVRQVRMAVMTANAAIALRGKAVP